jgi:hypothetical protein
MDVNKVLDQYLAQRAESRMPECCMCGKKAIMWVKEIRYRSKGEPNLRISGSDYNGPAPGFCFTHEREGSERLAQAVYFDQVEIGLATPDEWEMEFTDSSKVGGSILSIVPDNVKVEVIDSYSRSALERAITT